MNLTKEQKAELERRHKTERDSRVSDRIKAVLLRSEGWSIKQIGQALRIHRDTVAQHLADWDEQEKLKPENGGSQSHLSASQEQALDTHLQETTYSKVAEICEWVHKQFGVTYTLSGMTHWLHAHGFSYKMPKRVPAKLCPQQQEAFIEHYLELLGDTPDDEPIVFIDSVHPTMATKVTQGWIKTGQDKTIESTASRTRVNVIGSIELATMKVISDFVPTVNSDEIVKFFEKIKSNYPHAAKIHVILDQAGYHRSENTRLKATELGIELHFLPPYSPNLNPIERLWKLMNERVRDNVFFDSAKKFRLAIKGFLEETVPNIKPVLTSRINDNFQVLDAASSF